MKNIDINKIVVSNKISFGKKERFKYSIGGCLRQTRT